MISSVLTASLQTGAIMETAYIPAPLSPDALLQASRRLDWRFLLPDPNLGQVAYAGQRADSLVEALGLFSESLILLTPQILAGRTLGQFSLVAVHAAPLKDLQRAAGFVRPGGHIYVEAYSIFAPLLSIGAGRTKWSARPSSAATPGRLAARLSRLGFTEVKGYIHVPDFEACTRILPLGEPGAMGYLASSVPNRSQSGWKKLLSPLLARFYPCFSLIARRPDHRKGR